MKKINNIVLITVDALRYDHSNIVKNKIDEVLGKGINFTKAYSTGPCSSMSYIGYLSSKFATYPDEKYFITKPKLKRKRTLLFEVLKKNGYKTYVIANNPFHNKFGYDQGIDVMITKANYSSKNKVISNLSKYKSLLFLNRILKLFYSIIGLKAKAENKMPYFDSKKITEIVKNIVGKETDNNIFMQINYMDTHTPINLSNEYIRKNFTENEIINNKLGYREILEIRDVIDNNNDEEMSDINERLSNYEKLYYYETVYAADNINYLLKYFKELGRLKDTVFILHSDHGEYIQPEGKLLGHGHPVRSKKETLNVFYENLVHVPLTIWGLGEGEIEKVVSLVDLPPTILEILGIKKPTEWYGDNIFSEYEKPVIIEDIRYGDICYCVRTNDWAFAYNENTKQEYLFKTSPQDKKDVSSQNKELVKEMHKLINIHKKKIEISWREYLNKDINNILQPTKKYDSK